MVGSIVALFVVSLCFGFRLQLNPFLCFITMFFIIFLLQIYGRKPLFGANIYLEFGTASKQRLRFRANKTDLGSPMVFLLTVPRRFFCCCSSYMRIWRFIRRFCIVLLCFSSLLLLPRGLLWWWNFLGIFTNSFSVSCDVERAPTCPHLVRNRRLHCLSMLWLVEVRVKLQQCWNDPLKDYFSYRITSVNQYAGLNTCNPWEFVR